LRIADCGFQIGKFVGRFYETPSILAFDRHPANQMRPFLKYWLPLLIWLGVIFLGSTDLMSAEHTSRVIVPVLLWLKPGMSPETIRSILFGIRKCAHFSEYAILALLLWRALRSGPTLCMKLSTLFGVALLACAIFAASDEFHQSFVKSRTPSVRDVLLDVAGALFGLLIGASFAQRHHKKTRSTTEKELVDVRF
jgi:VanZ family protein